MKIPPCPPTPCREWQGPKNGRGYGQRTVANPRRRYVHRWVMSRLHGGWRGIYGKTVMHLCDNPACFRYDHLYLSTQKENAKDASDKGRMHPIGGVRGERNNKARLTKQQVLEIRAACAAGEFQRVVAARYDIGQTTVSHIVHRESWAWLD